MIICKRPVQLDDHLQEAVDDGVVVVGGGVGGGVSFRRRRKQEGIGGKHLEKEN